MSKLRISDAPLLPDVNGAEKIPTGGRGDLAISMEQVKTFAQGGLPQQLEDHINDTENPHQVSKSQVGLGNVDNTSDVNKPISTATQEALDLKADKTAVHSKGVTLPTYYTKEAGVNPVTGVANGAYFNVRSTDDETVLVEYQNVGGSAVATGKSYPSSAALNNIPHNNLKDRDADDAHPASAILDAGGRSQQEINLDRINIKDYGAIGDGTLHTLQEWVDSGKFSNLIAIQMVYEYATSLTNSIDYVAYAQALKFANSKVRTGLVSTIKNSGACVVQPAGEYNMQGITQAFSVMCNIVNEGASLIIPQSYSGTVFKVGSFTNVENLAKANIELPDVYKPTSNNALAAGSCGVRVANLNASRLVLGRISYFEDGLWLGGIGEGTVYSDIYLSQINYCKKLIKIAPGVGGWCNSNRIYGGNLHQSANFAGGIRQVGWSQLYMDGRSPATSIVGNTFIGTSFEGNAADYTFDVYGAYSNTLIGCYHETGAAQESVSLSGDTFTKTNHGLVVGDCLAFIASTYPIGMYGNTKYYVVEASADTFKVSLDRTGGALNFSSAGSNLFFKLAARFRFTQSVGGSDICSNNKMLNLFTPPSVLVDVINVGNAANNGEDSPRFKNVEAYVESKAPLYRARNIASGSNIPLYAAYKSGIKPDDNPHLWTVALTSDGITFRNSGADSGYITSSAGGALKYKRPVDTKTYDIATCTRTAALQSITALSVPSKGRGIAVLDLAGVALGELVTVTPYSALVDGIAIAWARVSEADKVQVCFYNWTDVAISLSAQMHVMATRNYY